MVDYRETLITFLRSDSLEQAAKELQITKAALTYRLQRLKKAGVRVPRKSNQRLAFDALEVAQFNALVKKYSKA